MLNGHGHKYACARLDAHLVCVNIPRNWTNQWIASAHTNILHRYVLKGPHVLNLCGWHMWTMACVEIEFRTIFDCIPVCLMLLLLPISDCFFLLSFTSWSFVCVFMCVVRMRVIGFFIICLFALYAELAGFFSVAGNNGAANAYRYNRRYQLLMNVDLVVIVNIVNAIVPSPKSPFDIFSHLIMSKNAFIWLLWPCIRVFFFIFFSFSSSSIVFVYTTNIRATTTK